MSTTIADKIKRCKIFRATEINKIHELYEVAQTAVDDRTTHTLFKLRCLEIDSIKEEFSKQHYALIALLATVEDANLRDEDTIRQTFDKEYFAIRTIYTDLFENVLNETRDIDVPEMQNSNIKLPKVELIKFNGDIKLFPTFIDMFNALVHENRSLCSIEKFNYLISSLSGPPLSLVKCLPMTTNNYETAYNSLVDRYSNKRLLAVAYWTEIENSTKLTSENPNALRRLLDIFSENLAALKNLEFPVDQWDFILVNMLLKRLDSSTVTRFEMHHGSLEIPTYSELVDFLNKHCIALDTLTFGAQTHKNRKMDFNKKSQNRSVPSSSFFVKTNNVTCSLCKDSHMLYKCPIFAAKTQLERFQFAKSSRLCLNCLSDMHMIKNCNSTSLCRQCKQKHHTLLHFDKRNSLSTQVETTVEAPSAASTSEPVNSLTGLLPKKTSVLLATALVEVLDSRGNFQKVRTLIDSGSQVSFITQKCVNRLGLSRYSLSLSVQGLGQMETATHSGGVSISLRPLGQLSPTLNVDAVILPKICNELPTSYVSTKTWSHIKNLHLADPQFHSPGTIDVLLGADIFPQILLNGQLSGNVNEPIALNTIFGYILLGKVHSSALPPVQSFFCTAETISLDNTLKKFWELETVPHTETVSPDDAICEQYFLDTFYREGSGRFVVSLPFRDNTPSFIDTRSLALNRFLSLERRLVRNSALYKEYSDFMKEYLDLGHMEPVSEYTKTPHTYYIPHHCVLKPESSTTKLRVVFNASAKSPSGLSLNDTLLVGPKLQKNIVTILLNFRLHRVVFTADIKQMYRQILINPDHKDYQRILWRFSPDEPIQDFRLNTVTYGVSSAPYLAIRTLLQLAKEEKSKFPLAAQVISTDTYIDDVVTGCSSLAEAHELQSQLIKLLYKGGFELRKWSSNDQSLLSHLPESYLCTNALSFDTDVNSSLKVLGLQWHPGSDSFSYKVDILNRPCTKRNILSELARIFDPLGILAPITFFTKHLIQHLWCLGLDWDAPPPDDVLNHWNQFKLELPLLSKFQLPRRISDDYFHVSEVHGFCDSSSKGYSAVIYFRFFNKDNQKSNVYFVCAKSKVAPLKTVSIPRLELCAAVLLSDLLSYVLNVYSTTLNFDKVFAWSDSQIALAWIKSSPHRWRTFVSNRVSFIQEKISPSCWYHIPSEENPADVASRGSLPSELLKNSLWWAGPAFLKYPPNSCLPAEKNIDLSAVSEEERKVTLTTLSPATFIENILQHFSSLATIQRIVSYVLRFIHNSRYPTQKKSDSLTYVELQNALLILVRHIQQLKFAKDILNLKQGRQPSRALRKLNVFLDNKDILRVGGRLYFSNLNYDQKFPALLPRCSRLTDLIIESVHIKYFHAGLQTVQFLISQQFWILSPKRAIRQVLSKCITCFNVKPKSYQPPMGNLPRSRISQVKPFLEVGTDYAGPFILTMRRGRGAKTHKAYLCLFVCMTTKALHLELASDLTAEAFLAAFRRFVARRGRCAHVYSDCGTNFVRANKMLLKFMQNSVSQEGIQWHFNPPSAPHFGGLWEAGVKSVKSHLVRVIGQQILTFEEFYTVLVQIEAILNSRPLTPLSSDPNDLSALTPGHFLTLEPLTAPPDEDLTAVPLGRLNRWQLVQRLHQDFWNRWHKEYLHTLQQRGKWTEPTSSVVPGTLVLIKNDLVSPLNWQLGRIAELHPGADGVARVATVRTTTGTYKRPLVKLCPLPLS